MSGHRQTPRPLTALAANRAGEIFELDGYGAVGMAGHLEIGDNVHFTGMAMVTRSFPEPGVYSSGIPAMPSADWRRNAARFRHLDELFKRVKQLENDLAQLTRKPEQDQT